MSIYDVFLDHEQRLVKVTAKGELFQSDGDEIITAARTKAMEYDYNILYDIRQATMTVLFSSWFDLPRRLDVYKDERSWNIKAAILVSPHDKAVEEYWYYETLTANLGYKLKIFFDEDKALQWLKDY